MIILDTNVLSELMRPQPTPVVAAWAKNQKWSSIYTTTVTAYEINFGIGRLPEGAKKRLLQQIWQDVRNEFLDGRFLVLDTAASARAAEMRIKANAEGHNNNDISDVLIAGIAARHDACIATRNTKHFGALGARLINPWDAGS